MICGVADDKGWEDKRTREPCNAHQEEEIGHSDEEHPRPDAQKHCGQLRVWVRFVFRPQNQVRPGGREVLKKGFLKKYVD